MPLLFCPAVARGPGRYHRAGEDGVWYASWSMRASWCESFRHFPDAGVDPFEIRRRAGRAQVAGARVLDLTDPATRSALGLLEGDLTGDDYVLCQAVADAARAAGLDGLLAPAAALPGARTLALFLPAVAAGVAVQVRSRVQRAPLDLVDHLGRIRPVPSAAAAFTAFVRRLVGLSPAQLRSRYRQR